MALLLAFASSSWLEWEGLPVPALLMALFVMTMIGGLWVLSQFPRAEALLRSGMAFNRAGQPVEAERCYRKALAKGSRVPVPLQVRLLANLGISLMDQGRYRESGDCLSRALGLGDPTGNCNDSIAVLLLLQGAQPQKALDMVDHALELLPRTFQHLIFPYDWRERFCNLNRGPMWALKAWALALLGRRQEARHCIEAAMSALDVALAGKPNYYRTAPLYGPDYPTVVRLGVSEAH